MPAPSHADLARALVDKFPDSSMHQLARILYRDNKERFRDVHAARVIISRVCGRMGKGCRVKVTHPLPPRDRSWNKCPPSLAEPWEPFVLPTPCRVLSLSDAHVPYHAPKAIEAAVEHARKHYKPDVLLLNGDHADFYSISRWERDPKKRYLVKELGIVDDSLGWLKGKFPKALRAYKCGNHDERWDKFIWNRAPELWDLPQCRLDAILHLEKHGFEFVTDQRPVMAGNLPVFHGHELGKGIFSPVNPARGAYLRAAHTILIGHSHVPSTHAQPDLWHSETTCWSQGCLCDLRPEYARINKWAWGFAVIEVDNKGEFNLHNFKVTKEGKVRTV